MGAKKILVVEDEAPVSQLIQLILSRSGYAVETAPDGSAGLKKAQTERFDIILTDMQMPGLTGHEMAEKLRAAKHRQPIVLVTGFAPKGGLTAFDGVILKPFSPHHLRETVARLLDAKHPETKVDSGLNSAKVPRDV